MKNLKKAIAGATLASGLMLSSVPASAGCWFFL